MSLKADHRLFDPDLLRNQRDQIENRNLLLRCDIVNAAVKCIRRIQQRQHRSTTVIIVQECPLVPLGVIKQRHRAVTQQALCNMRQDMLGIKLIFRVDICKTDRAAADLSGIDGILHEKFRHELAAGVAGALTVLCIGEPLQRTASNKPPRLSS